MEQLVGNYNDAWQSAIKTSPNLAEKGALQEAPAPGQGDTPAAPTWAGSLG